MLHFFIIRLQKLDWSIRHKLGLAFTLLLVCFILNGLISVNLVINIKNTEEQQRSFALRLERLQSYELAYQSQLDIYSDTIFITKAHYLRDSFGKNISSKMSQKVTKEADPSAYEFELKFADLYFVAFNDFSALQNNIVLSQLNEAQANWQKFQPDFEAVSKFLKAQRTMLEIERSSSETATGRTIFTSVAAIIGASTISIGLVFFLLFLIDKVLVLPLNRLQQGWNRVAEGELEQHLKIVNRDEIGELAHSFEMALQSFKQVLSGVQISESLRNVTAQLASVSKRQSAGSNEQVAALSQVMSAMHELGKTAEQIAQSAVQVADLTGTTLTQIEKVAEAGQTSQHRAHLMSEVVEGTLVGIEKVGQQVEEFRRAIQELNQQTENISRVVGLLGSIADEVHLLALNASIEAAGAGEAGQRFRVVAQEIKQLAARANRATQEARSMISVVQQSSRTALSQIEENQLEVIRVVQTNSGLRLSLSHLEAGAMQVGEAVGALHSLAGQVSERAEEIKQATSQQQTSNQLVIYSTSSVGEVAEQTAFATQQIADSSAQLEALANQLSRVLQQVRLAA